MLPKKLFYTVEAVLYIAYNAGHGPISSRDIAAKQGLTPRYLEQLMQKLVRAGILRGVRGPSGGYVLARERRRVSVGDIYEAIAEVGDLEEYESMPLGDKVIKPLWENAQKQMIDYLRKMTLAELCEQASSKNIRRELEQKMDFAI